MEAYPVHRALRSSGLEVLDPKLVPNTSLRSYAILLAALRLIPCLLNVYVRYYCTSARLILHAETSMETPFECFVRYAGRRADFTLNTVLTYISSRPLSSILDFVIYITLISDYTSIHLPSPSTTTLDPTHKVTRIPGIKRRIGCMENIGR